jgi:integrase
VKTIDAADLFAVVEEARRYSIPGMAARHDRPSEARARKTHAALSQLFGWLLRRRRVAANPMTTLHRPSAPSSRDRVLTNAEIRLFWAAAETLPPPSGSVVRLLLLTGCRLNEVAKLRWEEVSDDFATLTIPGERTKNGRALVVPLPPLARKLIADQERNGKFVFTTNGITPASGWSKVKERLDDAMGNVPPWVLHDLRRSCATKMSEIGIQPHIVEAVLNHVSGAKSGVAGVYNRHAYLDERAAALQKWASCIQSIVDDTKIVAIRR